MSGASMSARSSWRGRLVGLVVGEAEQQPERVAIGGDGVGTRNLLVEEPFGEERLESRGEQAHDCSPPARSSRSHTRANNSGDPLRYQ